MPPPQQIVANADQVFLSDEWTKLTPHLCGRGDGKAIEKHNLRGRDDLLVASDSRGTCRPPR